MYLHAVRLMVDSNGSPACSVVCLVFAYGEVPVLPGRIVSFTPIEA